MATDIVDDPRNQIKITQTHKNQSKEFHATEPQNQELVYSVLIYMCRLILRQMPQYTVIALCEVKLPRMYSYFLLKEF